MFGLVVRFDLKDAEAAVAFDRLVAETGEHIAAEPGTLMYVTNRVDGAPLARLFYEVYADRSAFEAHEATAHVRRFLAEREAHVASLRVEFVTPTGGKNPPRDPALTLLERRPLSVCSSRTPDRRSRPLDR